MTLRSIVGGSAAHKWLDVDEDGSRLNHDRKDVGVRICTLALSWQ